MNVFGLEQLSIIDIVQAQLITSTTTPTGVDTQNLTGNALLKLSTRITTDGDAVTFSLQHCDVATSSDSGWVAVSPSAIYDVDTGDADALDSVDGTNPAYVSQVRGINLQQLRRYVRLVTTIAMMPR
ncbi:MAG: hypothetical protein HC888_05880 [Candidatus Competibacteraceae bacterium]|nr:hypothetical protein [Candidatus Competibacteraceae bacterium]